jgi:predicted nucleic acid-binding protein
MIARRDWTRQWWDERSTDYELLTSVAVLDELARGDYEGKSEVLEMLERIPLLPIETPIAEIMRAYVLHKVVRKDPLGDALHLAVASFHKCDVLLTWNSRQLANENKLEQIRRVHNPLGLFLPRIVTPLELLGGDAA